MVKVIYSNGEVKHEDLTVSEAAIKLKTDDVQAIEFDNDSSNKLLEQKLAELLNIGFK
ncbi:TPA: hypothetical protein JLO99_002726 [Escherichia coli]|nr:hypothetical protein [Escherichia coli]